MSKDISEYLKHCVAEMGVALTQKELADFSLFAEELKKWNRKINLTAIKDDREIVVKHFTDSLTLLGKVARKGTLLDIGSGGGFPCIPLKILHPELEVVSVDAVEKKIMFQRHVSRLLNFDTFLALHSRAEELIPRYADYFDFIVSRAFSDLPFFASLAKPLLRDSGRIIAMKGRDGFEEAKAGEPQLNELGMRVVECIHINLPVSCDERYLIVLEKSGK